MGARNPRWCTVLGMAARKFLEGARLTALQDEAVVRWHHTPAQGTQPEPEPTEELSGLILAQHRANFDLWHTEDQARDPDATDQRIAAVKRAIDRLNQQRNDLAEAIDSLLHERLPQAQEAVLHSETPGMIVDRMSIMALKLYHTREETVRATATAEHREKNRGRLAILEQQRGELAGCLDRLMDEIAAGTRRFKLYRQMKMYNDPTLNPVLYRRGGS